jgi:C-terminal processing protease CtpA/Prc
MVLAAFPAGAAGKAEASPALSLTIEASRMPLGELIGKIDDQCAVVVTGLEKRYAETVSFTARAEPVEGALRRLLQQLDERNYALVFNRTRLTRVSVLPASQGDMPPPQLVPLDSDVMPGPKPHRTFHAVRITRVHEDTQAQRHGLKRGDLIIEYGGKRILRSQDLTTAVKEKGPDEAVEMLLVRNRRPIRMILNGGFIGINIISVTVPPEEAGQ